MRHLLKILLILVNLAFLGMFGLYVLTAHSEMRHERGAAEALHYAAWLWESQNGNAKVGPPWASCWPTDRSGLLATDECYIPKGDTTVYVADCRFV
jgi:hypothetical protein